MVRTNMRLRYVAICTFVLLSCFQISPTLASEEDLLAKYPMWESDAEAKAMSVVIDLDALSINPRDEETLNNRLLVLGNMEKWDVYIEDCDKILELTHESRAKTPEREWISLSPGMDEWTWDKEKSRIWAAKGAALAQLERLREALTCYDKALELNPRNVNALADKALCYQLLEKWEEAIDSCDKAIELDPKNFGAWCRKGGILLRVGKHEEALTCYDRALDINPSDWVSLNEKGLALYYLGRYGEALGYISSSHTQICRFRL